MKKSKVLGSLTDLVGLASHSASTTSLNSLKEGNWVVFDRGKFVISINQNIRQLHDVPNLRCSIVEYHFSENQLKNNGMPKSDMANIYYDVEDKIDSLLADNGVYMIAAETGATIRRSWYCGEGIEFGSTIEAFLRDEKRVAILIKAAEFADAAELLPTNLEGQIAGNHQILQNLESRGDDGSKPREVMHWVYLNSQSNSLGLQAELKNMGFSIEESTDEKIRFSKVSDVLQNTVDKETEDLVQLCARFICDYDGWETEVIGTGANQTRH